MTKNTTTNDNDNVLIDSKTNNTATVDTRMATHLHDWLEGLQQANDLLSKSLRFSDTHLQISANNRGNISLDLIDQLSSLPVFALTIVVQKQALLDQQDDDRTHTAFSKHLESWTQQNPTWQIIKVPHSSRHISKDEASKTATANQTTLSHTITPVITYNYILLPTEATNMQAGKKSAAAHLLDDSITAHLRQFIDALPIKIDMGGDAAIDCHIVSLAKILRPHRVICFDMDSTLIEQEVINELAKKAGIGDKVSEITESAMRGEIDFDTSFSKRVGLLKGLSTQVLDDIQQTLTISAGARPLITKLKAIGYHTVLVSGGFTYFAQRIADALGIDEVHANILDIDDGEVTGEVVLPIVNGERKALLVEKIAKREGVTPAEVVCVGDGANDLPMMAVADIGIAYHAKPIVRARADAAINATGLEGVMYVLGYLSDELD